MVRLFENGIRIVRDMNKIGNTPIYLKIRDDLAEQINSGQIGADERLPSEREMAAKLGAARETIREALGLLEGEGLVFRKRGSGYYASTTRLRYDPTNHVNTMRLIPEQGYKADSINLGGVETRASSSLAKNMSCDDGTPVILQRGVSMLNDRRVCYEEMYLLMDAYPEFLDIEYESPLTDFLTRRYGFDAKQIGFRARPTNLYGTAADVLEVRKGTPGIFITRIKAKGARSVWVDREYWLADVLEIVIGEFPQKS